MTANVERPPRDYATPWADELIFEIEESLAKHAEFERLYPLTHNCPCHDEPMKWNQDRRHTKGGYWRCAVKARAADRGRWHSITSLEHAKRRLRDGSRRRARSVIRAREAYDREYGTSPS